MLHGLCLILRDAGALFVHLADGSNRQPVILLSGAAEPLQSFLVIPRQPPAPCVSRAEKQLSLGIPLLSGLAVPRGRFAQVLHQATATVVIEAAKVDLRVGVALLGRLAAPLDGLDLIARHADPEDKSFA